jgi:eukaryotic-like serine/threonine-protein kinase
MNEEAIFHEARSITDRQERSSFLDRVCAGQPQLRASVEALIAASESSTDFLEQPLVTRSDAELHSTLASEGPGSLVGPYRLIKQIGEGGFGIVFLAEQEHPIRRQVAVKTIKPGMDTRQVIARFEGERQALALMEHPHIARILDGGVTPSGKPYFVMELVLGVPITEYCDKQRLTPRERLAMFIPICRAIQHAHQKGIIHRDLKPSNILIADQDGVSVPKVIDFGVAKALGEPISETVATTGLGRIIGTLEYMSPEQAEFRATDIDTRADIYSLGVMLYELLTGTTPVIKERLHSAAVTELLRVIREEDPPCPSSRLTDSKDMIASVSAQRKLEPAGLTKAIRGELDWIVMKCLEKDRNRRYETANGLVRDIERYLNDEPVEAGPPSAIYKLRKFAKKHRRLLGVAGAFTAFLGMAAVLAALLAVRASRAERSATLERDRALAETKRADGEASIARAVNEFLQQDLLSQADLRLQPADAAKKKDLTIRELLERASRNIEGRFQGQALTEAAIRSTLGNAYRAIGEYTEAQRHLERSQQLREMNLPPDHPELWESLHDLGLLDSDRGQYIEAERHLLAAMEGFRKSLGETHRDMRRSMASLAIFYQKIGKFDDSDQLYKKLLAEEQPGVESDLHETVRRLTGYALLQQARGHYAEADQFFHQALEMSQSKLGSDHPDSLTIQSNLGILYRLQGKNAEAERIYRRVLDASIRLLGEEHPDTLTSMTNLAAVYMAISRYGEAEQLFLSALDISQRVLGSDHADTLAVMNNLGVLYRALARYDEAEDMHRKALEGRRRILGDRHIDTLASINNLAAVCLSSGQPNKAQPLFEEAWQTSREALGAEHPQTLGSMISLAVLYLDQGRISEAEELFRQALALSRKILGDKHMGTLASLSGLARLLQDRGSLDEAKQLSEEALESFRATVGEGHPQTLNEMSNLATIYRKQKAFDKSIKLFEETLAARRQKLGDEHPHTIKTLAELGRTLLDSGRVDDGTRCLEEAYAAARKRNGPLPSSLSMVPIALATAYGGAKQFEKAEEVLLQSHEQWNDPLLRRQLIELYDAWGKPEEAVKWRTPASSDSTTEELAPDGDNKPSEPLP